MDRLILEDILTFAAGVIALGCFTGIITSWLKHRARRASVSPDLTARLDEISERLSRLDTGMDAVAVEIERISEGQRFTTKLLAERNGAVAQEKQRVQ